MTDLVSSFLANKLPLDAEHVEFDENGNVCRIDLTKQNDPFTGRAMTAQIHQMILDLDLDGVILEQKINHFLGEVAASVVMHKKAGQVQISFDMKEIQNSDQVMLKYTLKYKMPTSAGTIIEDNASSCPMYVGKGGITIFPQDQKDLFRNEV